MTLPVDRMALDDVGANPVRLANAIHDQLGHADGPVPVDEVARALDIVEIRVEPLNGIEAALVTDPERDSGAILLNARSSRQRRRFSLAHELGHFLNSWHRPTAHDGFHCSRADMMVGLRKDDGDRHRRQEGEANAFAIALLAPPRLVHAFLRGGTPDLSRVLAMADALEISREAAARRYVELHNENLAAVFGKDGRVIYVSRAEEFPAVALGKDDPLPRFNSTETSALSAVSDAVPEDWLRLGKSVELTTQTLRQQGGFSITLLHATGIDDDDDDGIDDAYERFSR